MTRDPETEIALLVTRSSRTSAENWLAIASDTHDRIRHGELSR